MLKRFKNIEGKNEQQLDFIRDQGDKQLDLIGKINNNKTKSIKFRGKLVEKIERLRKRVNEEDKENKSKKHSLVKLMRNDEYDLKKYGKLADFGNNLCNDKLSLDEGKNEQDKHLDLIYSLEKSVEKDKSGRPFSDEN